MEYCISKYQPQFYDSNSCYRRDEWTSFWDIGQSFNGDVLSSNAYIEVESRYINTAVELAQLSGCSYLIVNYLEGSTNDIMQSLKRNTLNSNLFNEAQKIKQGLKIPILECTNYLRLCLREYCWAIFANQSHNFSIKFGYDFYMYIHTALPKLQVENIVFANNLYFRP